MVSANRGKRSKDARRREAQERIEGSQTTAEERKSRAQAYNKARGMPEPVKGL